MRTTIAVAAVSLLIAGCCCDRTTAERPSLPAVGWDDGAPRARRVSRPDTRAMVATRVRILTGSAADLAAAGLPIAGGPVVLPPETTDAMIRAAASEAMVLPELSGMSGQRHSAFERLQASYIADYRMIDGLAKPEIEIADYGTTAEVVARVVDGRLIVDQAEVTVVSMPSLARCSAILPGYGRLAWEEPYLVTARSVPLPPDFAIAPGARLALPMRYHATRACAQVRTLLPPGAAVEDGGATGGLEHGVSVAILTFDWTYAPEPDRLLFDADSTPATAVRLQTRGVASVGGLDEVAAALAKATGLSITLDADLPASERTVPAWVAEDETVLAALRRLAAENDLLAEVGPGRVTLGLPGRDFPAPPLGIVAVKAPAAALLSGGPSR